MANNIACNCQDPNGWVQEQTQGQLCDHITSRAPHQGFVPRLGSTQLLASVVWHQRSLAAVGKHKIETDSLAEAARHSRPRSCDVGFCRPKSLLGKSCLSLPKEPRMMSATVKQDQLQGSQTRMQKTSE